MCRYLPFVVLAILLIPLTACGPTPEEAATQTSTALTATAHAWTATFTSTVTDTPTQTFTSTSTFTPTITDTPTLTNTPTITLTPTYDFPKVRVNVPALACRYGPSIAYLWHFDLHEGDTGVVWGRHANSVWLYVRMDNLPDACWVHPYYLDIEGDVSKMMFQQVRMPMTNALYAAPTGVRAVRNGNEVTVSWNAVWMTLDDDRGYFLDVWVCQNGYPIWTPVSLPDQYHTEYTFTDEAGCSYPSGGKLYTVEKHGYPDPVVIPWPKAGEETKP
jgi:hypothetical protein